MSMQKRFALLLSTALVQEVAAIILGVHAGAVRANANCNVESIFMPIALVFNIVGVACAVAALVVAVRSRRTSFIVTGSLAVVVCAILGLLTQFVANFCLAFVF